MAKQRQRGTPDEIEICWKIMRVLLFLLACAAATRAFGPSAALRPAVQSTRSSSAIVLAAKGKSKKGKKTKTKSEAPRPAARGFGVSPEKAQLEALEKSVAALLKDNNGDVNAAHEAHFAAGKERLQAEDPARFSAMEQDSSTGVGREALMELQWDTLSAFASYGKDTLKGQKAKLSHIATAACSSLADGASILDVGCGDGVSCRTRAAAGTDCEAPADC